MAIPREMKRRVAIELVIGHVKAEPRMERNYLKGRDGDPGEARSCVCRSDRLKIRYFPATKL